MKKLSLLLSLFLLSSLLYAVTPITPVILADNSECLFRVVAYEEGSMSFTLKAQCENMSESKTYTFLIDDATVNGLMENSTGYAEVSPKKKANMNITFYGLNADGIDIASDINLYFRVYDSNDYLSDSVGEGNEHVYPYGKDKQKSFIRAKSENDLTLINTNDVSVVVIDKSFDSKLELKVYLENNTDKNVLFSLDDSSINGYMADPYWATSVLPYSSKYSTISWSQRTLDENFIFEVEDIEFELKAYDYDDWLSPNIVQEQIKIEF